MYWTSSISFDKVVIESRDKFCDIKFRVERPRPESLIKTERIESLNVR